LRGELAVDDILALIAIKRKVTINDISQIFCINPNVTKMVVDFLVRFDFVEFREDNVMISKTWNPFFDEMLAR
jgi:hypothetical protein